MKLRTLAIAALLAMTFAVTANGQDKDIKDKEKAAEAAADHWLPLVDAGNYEQSWDDAALFFREVITKIGWRNTMLNDRVALGKVLSRQLKSMEYKTQLPGVPDGQYVLVQYNTSFENKKESVETVTPMLDRDGKWRVAGYFIK